MSDAAWRSLFSGLLDVARLGAQFPDAAKWRALLDLLGREGPRGRPLKVTRSPASGLPTARSLAHLHRLQFIAREFFKTVRQRPSKEARAFSMALAALELPPVVSTHARLVSAGDVTRFLVLHERLDGCALRYTLVIDQGRRGPISLGKDQLARVSDELSASLRKACVGSARETFLALSRLDPRLQVREVVRGQLGPLVSAGREVPADAPVEALALQPLCTAPGSGVLCVTLERLGADVAQHSVRDPWAVDEPPVPGFLLARERRLFCTPGLEAPLRTLVGKQVLVRSA